MPADQAKTGRQIGGDEIIAEILRNAEAGQFRMRRSVVVPSVYHLYLHQSDYDLIRPVFKALREEARTALAERLGELNHKARPGKFAKILGFDNGEPEHEYRILDKDFTIEFYPDVEGTLEVGDMEIRSELASAPAPEFDGAMTRHVTRRQGSVSYSEAAGQPPAAPPADPEATLPITQPNAQTTSGTTPHGRLTYTEAGLEKEYLVVKEEIAVGRGGKAVWVDLRLDAAVDVSREHCRIRRDGSGRHFITDVSQFGTSLNGQPLVPNKETELPAKAILVLANVIKLEWENV